MFIMDRGYGRIQLINALNSIGVPYIIRLRSNVIVWLKGKGIALSRLRYKEGKAIRYSRVLYRKDRAEVVDLIIYKGRGFKEAWYLVVPCWWDFQADEVVELYRERMQIEQGFRDWKTHLGVRGLKLKVNRDERLNRLLLSLSIAYILLLLLGFSSFASRVRRRFESPRRKPRHGTVNTLSVFTLAIAMLSAMEIFDDVIKQLTEIVNSLKVKSALSLIRMPY
ncbi:MAG: transposase [Thermodesulfovibrionales bacterium]